MACLGFLAAACARGTGTPAGFQGVVEFDERRLSFDVPGRVLEVRVTRGGAVHAGDVVAVLDDSLERPALAVRRAELDAANAQLALLRAGARVEDLRGTASQLAATRASEVVVARALARQQRLLDAHVAPPAVVDELQNSQAQLRGQREVLTQRLALMRHGARPEELAAAQARVDQAQAAIAALDARLAHYTLHAPADGVVTDVAIEPGEVVGAGAPLASLADVDHPYVDVFVPEGRMNEVRRDGTGVVRVDAYRTGFPARVERVAERTEFTPRYLFSERERSNLSVRVRVRVADPGHRLHAGLPAFAALAPVAP